MKARICIHIAQEWNICKMSPLNKVLIVPLYVCLMGIILTPHLCFADNEILVDRIKPKQGRVTRQLGDIFLGASVGFGMTNFINRTTYQSTTTKIVDHGMYAYNVSFFSNFILSSYASLVLEYGFQSIRFNRKNFRQVDSTTIRQEDFFEQWFNRINVSGRFLLGNIFFFQTGPSLLLHYDSKTMARILNIEPKINDRIGASLQWQIGFGISQIIGYKDNADPQMTIDLALNAYIPVAGYIMNSAQSQDTSGNYIRIKKNPLIFEFSLAITGLI